MSVKSTSSLKNIRSDFSLLCSDNVPCYFDNAATALKPKSVIQAITEYYTEYPANVHRGTHALSMRASKAYEDAREQVRSFLEASNDYEIIFTAGTTDSINLICAMYENALIHRCKNAVVTVSEMDHHSVFVPWQQLCKKMNGTFYIIPTTNKGTLEYRNTRDMIYKSDILCITGMSNVTGYTPNIQNLLTQCRRGYCRLVLDGAQLIAHHGLSLRNTPVDAVAFSGHKLCGPTGIGVLCIRRDWLCTFTPTRTGGGTIKTVSVNKTEFHESPDLYEAGTPHIAGAIGLAAALKYLKNIGINAIHAHDTKLHSALRNAISVLPGLRYIGDPNVSNVPIVSFVSDVIHAHDIAFALEQQNIYIRVGHLCAMPLLRRFNCEFVARISCYFYNTLEEIAVLKNTLESLSKTFS